MNWDAISEVFGAIAVILTLIYLAIQIRQNTESGRDAALLNVISDFAHSIEELNRDADLTRIWFERRNDFQALERIDKHRFGIYLNAAFRRYQIVLYQIRQRKLDKQAVTRMVAQMKYAFEGPGTREWWEQGRNMFSLEFQEHIETLVPRIENSVDT